VKASFLVGGSRTGASAVSRGVKATEKCSEGGDVGGTRALISGVILQKTRQNGEP